MLYEPSECRVKGAADEGKRSHPVIEVRPDSVDADLSAICEALVHPMRRMPGGLNMHPVIKVRGSRKLR